MFLRVWPIDVLGYIICWVLSIYKAANNEQGLPRTLPIANPPNANPPNANPPNTDAQHPDPPPPYDSGGPNRTT